MSLKLIKNHLSIITLLLLSGSTLFITTCTKDDDPEKVQKEAFTLSLNADISSFKKNQAND